MKLTRKKLLEMLARAERPAAEQVLASKLVRKSISFNKEEWNVLFPDWPGIEFKVGKSVEIVRSKENARKVEIANGARERLGLANGDRAYVTRRNGKLFLKRLELTELPAVLPGFYVFDSFTDTTVTRAYQTLSDPAAVTDERLQALLRSAGRFRHDPVAPFRKMPGMLGCFARSEFAGGLTADDKEWAKSYVADLAANQEEDGSWQKAVPATAFNVIRLLDLGRTNDDACVERAVDWLLTRPDPVGYPGLWMSSDRFLKGFNEWKAGGGKGQRGRKTPDADKQQFWENRDLFGVPSDYCEARFTWTNGVVLGALLKCGLYQHERVVLGLKTLLKLGHAGGWCGCGYFHAGRHVEPDDSPVDLNRFPTPEANEPSHALNWFSTADDIKTWASPWGEVPGLDVGDGQSLVVGARSDNGGCARAVHWGLSYHPAFHRSNLEAIFALRSIAHQYQHGPWRGMYPSFVFGMLERCRHPLSTFALLRSMPLLIREQKPGGLWDETEDGCALGKSRNDREWPAPSPAEGSLLILKALNTHGLLKDLLPRKTPGKGSRRSKKRAKTSV